MGESTAALKHVLLCSYLGTEFCGWQYQPEKNPNNRKKISTVQGRLTLALEKALSTDAKALRMRAASRTDTGVHSHGQVVEFYSPKVITSKDGNGNGNSLGDGMPSIDSRKFLFSLNSMLPKSVRVMWVSAVPDAFHVIKDVEMKQYNYYLSLNSVCENPFTAHSRLHILNSKFKPPFDLEKFKQGARLMEGKHDFAAFSNKTNDARGEIKETVRHVTSCDCFQDQHGVYLRVQGKGFLYKQVRHMVGALLWAAQGKMPLERIEEALREGHHFVEEGKRKWQPAPAVGLHLMWVQYTSFQVPKNINNTLVQ